MKGRHPAEFGPCPRCKGPLEIAETGKLDLPSDLITILGCTACQIMAGHVDGIEDVWRELSPGVVDQVIQDGWDGVRQYRFLHEEEGVMLDPGGSMFDPMGMW